MITTPAERAAALSARIHREINAGRWFAFRNVRLFPSDLMGDVVCRPFLRWDDAACLITAIYGGDADHPFARLGAELRAIAHGNAGSRK